MEGLWGLFVIGVVIGVVALCYGCVTVMREIASGYEKDEAGYITENPDGRTNG